jgi:hypothetical protein
MIKPYRSYVFRDQDPVIAKVHTLFEVTSSTYRAAHEASGVATGTMGRWFNGQTKRPQFATVNAVTRAFGIDLLDGFAGKAPKSLNSKKRKRK